MSSFLEEFHGQIPNATGIAYEVPLITSVVNLRTFLTREVRRVGVLSRPAFSGYIARQQKLAAMEDVSIIEIPLDEHPSDDQIESSVEVLCRKVKVDALWILNDNVLLNPEHDRADCGGLSTNLLLAGLVVEGARWLRRPQPALIHLPDPSMTGPRPETGDW